jgi:hypothetical protein
MPGVLSPNGAKSGNWVIADPPGKKIRPSQ